MRASDDNLIATSASFVRDGNLALASDNVRMQWSAQSLFTGEKENLVKVLRRLLASTTVLAAAISVGAGVAAPEAHAGTTLFWNSVVQYADNYCVARFHLGIINSGGVARRNNYGYNRYSTCLNSDYGTWLWGAYYIGGGVKACSASGSFLSPCSIDSTKQSDPYIKNNGIGNASGEGSFQF